MSAVGGILPATRLAWRAAAGWLIGYLVSMLVGALLPAVSVLLLREVLGALTSDTHRGLVPGAVGLVLAGVAAAAVPAGTGYLRTELGRRIGRQAQADLYLATARLPGLARLEDPEFHDRLRMAAQAGRSSPAEVLDGAVGVGQGAVLLAGLVAVLAAISPVVAGIAVLGLVPALMAEVLLTRARMAMLWRISPTERREHFYADLQTSLTAAKELRLFGLFDLFRVRMIDELTRADTDRRRMDRREVRVQLALGVLSAVVLGAGLVWAIAAAGAGRLGVDAVSAFIVAVTGLQAGSSGLVYKVSALYRALLMYQHYRTVLAAQPDLPLAATPLPVPPLRRGIELRDVWFRYGQDQPWVLRGVSMEITRGNAVALVGLNGAGKSTLVKLLCRFYDPERGSVLWDGVDLRELDVAGLRDRIGAVFQDYVRYDLTAAENIGLGDVADLDRRDRIRSAADRAGVHGTVKALPHGYDTLLSREFPDADDDPGVQLSGGQWQRIALARSLMRERRDLLILDEPSSGLDAAAEHEVHRRLRTHRADATSLLISHRLGTVRDADEIVVLADGVIVERGTHAQLIAAAGRYADLFHLQAEGYTSDGDPGELSAVESGAGRGR